MTKEQPKTFWNYRVILDKDKNGHPFYSIRGVHYGNFGKKITGWDAEETRLTFDQGDSISGFFASLANAIVKPVLMVKGDTLIELGERPAEMFVGQEGDFPAVINE